ncbi:uncharacterized protein FFB14_01426 [Fusarium fujikuroi]|nr:uncharacterized protein FFB14_01426 [Fusarium fujikuroi]
MAMTNTARMTRNTIARDGGEYLAMLSPTDRSKSNGVFQIQLHGDGPELEPCQNGFVWAATNIYDSDSALNIRVEDMWLAILAQLKTQILYRFRITKPTTIPTFSPEELNNPTEVANRLSNMVETALNDLLAGVLMPDFSQTTPEDTVSAALLLRGKYCPARQHRTLSDKNTRSPKRGIFIGEPADWDRLREKLAAIRRLRKEMEAPVNRHLHFLDRMLQAGKYHHDDAFVAADDTDPKR